MNTVDEVIRALIEQQRELQARVARLEAAEYVARAGVADRYRAVIGDALFCCHYDGPEPYETNYQLNTHGHRGQAATREGGIIGRPGRFGKAVQVAEATTNLLPNPSVETNTTGFVFARDGTAPVRERSAAAAWIGGYGLRWVIGSSPQTLARVQQPTGASPSGGQPYTLSVYVRGVGSAVGNAVYLTIVESGGATGDEETSGPNVTLTTEWQRLTHTHTVLRSDRTNLHGRLVCPAPVAGNELHLDGWQVEKKAYATPYADGSLGAGHAWTGTAHASSSTRAAARLAYASPLVGTRRGSVMLWASRDWGAGDYLAPRLLDDATGLALYMSPAHAFDLTLGGTAAIAVGNTLDYAAGEWVHLCITYDLDTAEVRLYLNGALAGEGTPGATGWGNALTVGNRASGDRALNGLIDDLVIVGRCLDAAEVRAVYESGAPVLVITDPVAFGSVS